LDGVSQDFTAEMPGSKAKTELASVRGRGLLGHIAASVPWVRVGLGPSWHKCKPCIGQPCDCDLRPDVARGSAQETGLKPFSTQYVGIIVPPWSWDLCVQRRSTP